MNENTMNVRLTFMRWLPRAVFITAVFFSIYITSQQALRFLADDPQVEIAKDAALALSRGADPTDMVFDAAGTIVDLGNVNAVEMQETYRPFITVFDASGKVLAASAVLGGKVPTPPVGVFSYTDENNEDRFTWQPLPSLRLAAVMVKVPPALPSDDQAPNAVASSTLNNVDGTEEPAFVLVSRSMRETDARINELFNMLALIWIVVLVTSLGYSIYMSGRKVDQGGQKDKAK